MKIRDDFIKNNARIEIISGDQEPTPIPDVWQPVLNNCDILVAIADMHMFIPTDPQDNFKYGADAMLDFLEHLDTLKTRMEIARQKLRIYQLGDLYEFRFPSPHSSANITAGEIRMSDPKNDEIITSLDALRTHLIYGNHDFENRHFPGFRFGALEGAVYLEHGFAAVPWHAFANPEKPLWDVSMFVFQELRRVESFFNKLAVAVGMIDEDDHAAIGVGSGATERGDFPDPTTYPDRQLDHYSKVISQNRGLPNCPRVCIIGHTHQPIMIPDFAGNECIFVDAGAWTNGRSDFAVVTNEEIAICRFKRA